MQSKPFQDIPKKVQIPCGALHNISMDVYEWMDNW